MDNHRTDIGIKSTLYYIKTTIEAYDDKWIKSPETLTLNDFYIKVYPSKNTMKIQNVRMGSHMNI